MSQPRIGRRRGPASVLALILVVAACGQTTVTPSASPSPTAAPATNAPSATPTPSPSPAASPADSPLASASAQANASLDPATAALYDTIETQVTDIRELQPKRPVQRAVISGPEYRAMVPSLVDEDNPADRQAAVERLYKALGLIA
ncbi:MAG: hypothetical protein ACJ761_06800, partial [Chloroflexota bacterium]